VEFDRAAVDQCPLHAGGVCGQIGLLAAVKGSASVVGALQLAQLMEGWYAQVHRDRPSVVSHNVIEKVWIAVFKCGRIGALAALHVVVDSSTTHVR
jgi:hypothetical protein